MKKKKKIDRKVVLLKAAYDLLKRARDSMFVESPMEMEIFYDGTNCDGSCLMEDIATELGIEEE